MLKIVTVPDKILTSPSKSIKKIDGKVKKLAKEMLRFLKTGLNGQPLGVGLSACQIGRSVRLFIVFDRKNNRYLTFINPKIIWKSKKMIASPPGSKKPLEGCLSVPDVWGTVKRHQKIKVSFQDLKGVKKTKSFSDFSSCVIQHENDHINGIVFVQRALEQKSKLYKIEKDEEGKDRLLEIEI